MSILNRTAYYDDTDGVVRFWDWASVDTTLGGMVEPFVANSRAGRDGDIVFDPEDVISKITSIERRSIDKEQLVLSGGGHLHGGYQLSRSGR